MAHPYRTSSRTKRFRLTSFLLALCMTVVAGCELSEELEEEPVDESEVTVSEDTTQQPQIDFSAPLDIDSLTVTTIVEGEGPELEEGDVALIQALLMDAKQQTVQINTWGREPRAMHLTVDEVGEGLYTALVGQKFGARVLLQEPEQDDEPTGARVAVLDVLPNEAMGEEVEPRDDLPSVEMTESGEPKIKIGKKLEKPSGAVSQPLIRGEGKQIEAGQTVTMQYHGIRWEDQEVIDSTWAGEGLPRSYMIGVGEMPEGLDDGILEQRVGSRLLLVLPPEVGYPTEGVTVFVVDLLSVSGEPVDPEKLKGE